MVNCDICVEVTNKRNKIIKCIHCNFTSCISCCKTYILGSLNNAKCMGCKKEWNRKFLTENFPRCFIDKDYKKHKENILFDRQLSMMAETQPHAERKINLDKLNNDIGNLKKQISEFKIKLRQLENKKWQLKNNINVDKVIKEKFFGHCPEKDCRGFVTNSWACGICDTKVCKSCKEKLTEDHECDENTVKNLELLKKDTKPCPNCKIPIFKISGCQQMWCTQCHIAYSWATGEIVKRGAIHNPHFFEWQNTNQGENGQIHNNCLGDQIARTNIYLFMKNYHNETSSYYFHYFNIFINHCDDIERRRYQIDMDNYEIGTYLDLRIEYLIGNITEKAFKTKIQCTEKRVQKKYDIFLIIDMFVQTGRSILEHTFRKGNILTGNITIEEVCESKKIIEKLIDYTNKSFVDIESLYKNKIPRIKIVEKEHSRWSVSKGSYTDFELN